MGEGREAVGEELPLREVAARTVTGSLFQVASQGTTLVLGFARMVLLARLLTPADFGLFALASFFAGLFQSVSTFGLDAALVQRERAEPEAISTHFVLRLGLRAIGLALAGLCFPLLRLAYADRPLVASLVVALAAVSVVGALISTPTALLRRRLAFRRLATLDTLSSAAMLVVAPLLAWAGAGPWSLVLGEQLTGMVVSFVGVWLYRPPWRLSLRLDRRIAREYLRFGMFVLANIQITLLLDQFDDFWTGTALGSAAAGFYSKAYEFARYPRRILARPLQPVFFSAYARLRSDRSRLSQAYFRFNSLVVRVGFLLGLVMALTAPEWVRLLLTDTWLPMVSTFRLMVVYTLLDPLIVTAGDLATAVGHPDILTRIKGIQLAVFIPSVVGLAWLWGIEGVAIAADLMLLVGIFAIFRRMREFVDFSLRRLFGLPVLALVVGAAAGIAASLALTGYGPWVLLLGKASASAVAYSAILLAFERAEYVRNVRAAWRLLGLR